MGSAIQLRRWSARRDRLRSYRVFIDAVQVGKIRDGETQNFTIPPADHRVQLRVDWCRSVVLTVHVAEEETSRLQCGPSGGSWDVLFDLLLRPGRYIALRLDD